MRLTSTTRLLGQTQRRRAGSHGAQGIIFMTLLLALTAVPVVQTQQDNSTDLGITTAAVVPEVTTNSDANGEPSNSLLTESLTKVYTEQATNDSNSPNKTHDEPEKEKEYHDLPERCEEVITHFEVVALEWHEVMIPFSIGLWVLVASLAKLIFHYTPLPRYLPESCLLVIIGFILGGIVAAVQDADSAGSLVGALTSDLFFLYLLPPIMLEAGYFMPARAFFANIGTILLYAVIGTLFNTFTIGFSLYGISVGFKVGIGLLECLTFSSLISAVDPVAVLAVFEEIHVNEVLHILVFGESLLNDAVTVVLYRMFEAFNAIGDNLSSTDVVLGIVSFFVVSIGGILIGLVYGVITAFCTKYTIRVRVIEPIFVFVMSYLSYLTAEMFKLSPILSIVACAMFMKPYVEANISRKSHTTIKYFMKMLSSISETIIFIFLGATAVSDTTLHKWNTPFVLFCLIFCFVYRFLGVLWQTALVNQFRLVKIGYKDQFVMGYGGIRGAIAFSLVTILCKNQIKGLPILFTTTIVVVMFTIFIQGMTIKPIVEKLRVKKAEEERPSMNQQIFERFSDHLLAGLEDVLGHLGSHHLKDSWTHFEKKTIRTWLVRDHGKEKKSGLLAAFTKIEEKEALEYVNIHGALPSSGSMGNMLKETPSGHMLYQSESQGRLPFEEVPLNDDETNENELSPKDRNESIGHHMDLLAKSLYRPRKRFDNRQSRHYILDDEVEEPKKLMHRSMTIQVRHRMSVKSKRHRQPRFQRKQEGGAGVKDGDQNSNQKPPNGATPQDPIMEDDEDIITFKARPDEVDATQHEEQVPVEPTAAETSLPWKRPSQVELSTRAQTDSRDADGMGEKEGENTTSI